ncbi:MAG: cation:proton antiporter [Tenericutes bacterium]|nr:cation:proton antiporter [Mycoplasmatota bacterium]
MLILAAEATSWSYQLILLLSITIIIGLFAGRFFERKRIPNLTAYILIGLIFGGIIVWTGHADIVEAFEVIINIGIGFIAFSIGLELNFKKIKKRTREVIIVTLFQAMFAFILTFFALYILVLPLHIALLIGSLAIATEPGPILLITKKMHASGPLTDTLVPLHGVEDSITIMLFGITLSYAVSVEKGSAFGFMEILTGPVLEIVFSLIIGLVIGYILVRIIRYLKYEDVEKDVVILISTIAAILASIAIASSGFDIFGIHVHLSPILLPMATGIFFSNLSSDLAKHETERIMDLFSAPILILFFSLLGAEIVILLAVSLEMIDLILILVVSLIYVVMRFFGKLGGSWVGGKVAHSDASVTRYLGFCLLPQAQAAIGLAFFARSSLAGTVYGTMILIVIMISTIVNGLFGPLGVRHALMQCHGVDGNFCNIVHYAKADPERHHHH